MGGGGGGEEVCGAVCVGVLLLLDLLRLLLTQSETKFPAIILMTHRH